MPSFCRHSRLIQNCPICSREQSVELRPIVSSSAPRSSLPRTESRAGTGSRSGSARSRAGGAAAGSGGVRVRRLSRGADDGYHSPLLPGLRSSSDAERLAEELAFAQTRLIRLEQNPPGLYAEVASGAGDVEERAWLGLLIAYLCPLDGEDPFAAIGRARTSWSSGELPALDGIETGPRSAHDPGRGLRSLEAYRAWAARAGSQAAAYTGEATWTPERRFARVFERLALPGLHRDARFDLLVTLGRLGVFELRSASLQLGGNNEVTVAAKRALGIGDPLLLERRAAALAAACGVELAALDLGLHNWGRGEHATLGLDPDTESDPDVLQSAADALGCKVRGDRGAT
jgi:hypothetical protein